jgi:hypothetical protein
VVAGGSVCRRDGLIRPSAANNWFTQMRGARSGNSHQPGSFLGFEVMILRRNRGLAASPPVPYRLKVAESLLRKNFKSGLN